MKISVFSEYSSIMGRPLMKAFIKSLRDLKEDVVLNDLNNADVAVLWSTLWHGRMAGNQKVWNLFHKQKKPVIIIEVGVFERGKTFRIGINGINQDGIFCNENSPNDRIEKLNLKMVPWKTIEKDTDIVICGQHPKSEQWSGLPKMEDFVISTIQELRKHTQRRIVVRPHPRYKFKLSDDFLTSHNTILRNPLYTDGQDNFDFPKQLETAHTVISHSSNPAIEAVMAGIPAFVSGHSFCYELGNHIDNLAEIETPKYADRAQWLANLSYTEWTLDEICQGIPWQRLKPAL